MMSKQNGVMKHGSRQNCLFAVIMLTVVQSCLYALYSGICVSQISGLPRIYLREEVRGGHLKNHELHSTSSLKS
jgi:hypothetical protein